MVIICYQLHFAGVSWQVRDSMMLDGRADYRLSGFWRTLDIDIHDADQQNLPRWTVSELRQRTAAPTSHEAAEQTT